MPQTKQTFDFEAAVRALREGWDLNGKNGILTPLIKQLTEAARSVDTRSAIRRMNWTRLP